jgi:type IV secretion system protein VirD4
MTKKAKELKPEILIGRVASGKFKGKLLKFRGQQFVGLSAPTRSGKGVGIVIPNLVNYPDSTVTNDTKLENFRKTAGFRQSQGQEVFLFSPDGFALNEEVDRANATLRSHRWNPMSYIRRNHIYRIGDILTIAAVFYPLTGDKNDIWNELAGKLFKGLTLFMLDNETTLNMPVTFTQLLKLTTPDGGLTAWMKEQIKLELISDDCKAEFNAFIAAPDETKGSILSNLVSPLAIFSDAVCAAATSDDDFDLRQIRRKRMSIYVGVQPTNLKKFSKLLNLFWSQLIGENTYVLPEDDPSLKYQCLMVLDEFTSLGRVDIIQQAIGYTAGYNMRFLLIYQTDAQLDETKNYGKEGAIVLKDNLAVSLIYPPKKVDAITKATSETLGYKTIKVKNRSRSKGSSASTTIAESDQKRALMLPQEIVELGFEKYKGVGLKQIILMENMRPMIADKIIYFDDPAFMSRVQYSMDNIPEIPLLDLSHVNPLKSTTIKSEDNEENTINSTITSD